MSGFLPPASFCRVCFFLVLYVVDSVQSVGYWTLKYILQEVKGSFNNIYLVSFRLRIKMNMNFQLGNTILS